MKSAPSIALLGERVPGVVCRTLGLAGGAWNRYCVCTLPQRSRARSAAGEPSPPATGGHVSGPCAGRRAGERSIAARDRENEPDMTTYPVDFYRRSEQKWALRAWPSSAGASTPQPPRVGSGRSDTRNVMSRMPWLGKIGQSLRAGYDTLDDPLPEHLAALLKELKRR
jgi:hypothetical protein